MTFRLPKLEPCSTEGCTQIALVYIRGKWYCKTCEAAMKYTASHAAEFILKGSWPGKDIKNDKTSSKDPNN